MDLVEKLKGKKILIVDDEPDIIETLQELLEMCSIDTAASYEAAVKFLQKESYNAAILDIMGVRGYDLLKLAREKGIPTLMLTAHALSPEHTVTSFRKGAAFFVPKEEMGNIETFLNDVLEAKEKGHNLWGRWLERLDGYYIKRFGPKWKDHNKDFWENFTYHA